MSNAQLAVVIGVVGIVVSAAGVYLGIPAWRLSKHAVAVQVQNDEQAEFNRRLAKALTGQERPDDPSPDHPSLNDAIGDLSETISELAIVSTVLAYHLADPHGGEIPRRLLEKWS